MSTPSESRRRLLSMIKKAERPISIQEVIDFENNEQLWFGPRVDAIDFLFARQVLGILRIDPKTNKVEYVNSS